MPFGFDPSIILAQKQYTGPDANETMRTLSQLAMQGVQQKQAEATLADLVNQRQRADQLQSIYASGGDPDALMRGGFGADSYAAKEQRRKSFAEEASDVGQVYRNVKDTPSLLAANQALLMKGHPKEHVALLPQAYEGNEPLVQHIASFAIPAKDQAEIDSKQSYYDALAGKPTTRMTGDGQLEQWIPETKAWVSVGGKKPIKPGPSPEETGGGLDDAAIEEAAQTYKRTGQMVPLGMGKAAAAARAKILNRAAGLEGDVAGNKADYHATTASLAKLQTQSDFIDSFEKTALKNLDTFIGAATDVGDAGSPYLNHSLRSMQNKFNGDPKMSRFIAAGQTARAEIGKILSGSTGNGALSDSARHEVEQLIPEDATLSQILAAADILKKDMTNRKVAVDEQLTEMRKRTGGNVKRKAKPVAPALGPNEVMMKDPNGVPHAVDKSEVDQALAHEWTRA